MKEWRGNLSVDLGCSACLDLIHMGSVEGTAMIDSTARVYIYCNVECSLSSLMKSI